MVEKFKGHWKIFNTGNSNHEFLKGCEFRLSDNGDIVWKTPNPFENGSLFSCTSYVVVRGDNTMLRYFYFEFKKARLKHNGSILELSYRNLFSIKCQKLQLEDMRGLSFNLLPALEQQFFSDIIIRANNGKEFHIHEIILRGSFSNVEDCVKFLEGKSEEVIYVVLHYSYCETLPQNITDSIAESCIDVLSLPLNYYSKIVAACQRFLHNHKLQNDFMNVIAQLHSCIDQIIEQFKLCCEYHPFDKSVTSSCDNSIFTLSIKAIVKEVFIFIIELVRLCYLFNDNQSRMSPSEVSEVLDFCKKHFHLMIKQFEKLVKLIKSNISILSNTLGSQMANYLSSNLPELLKFCQDFAQDLEKCLKSILNQDTPDCQDNNIALNELNKVLDSESLLQVQSFFHILIDNLRNIQRYFIGMTPETYSRSIGRNCESLMAELPVILSHVEDIVIAIDEKLEIHEFKFWFILETSKVGDTIRKVAHHKNCMQGSLATLTQYIARSVFTSDLVELNLLDENLIPQYHSPVPDTPHVDQLIVLARNDPKLFLTRCVQLPNSGSCSELAIQLSKHFHSGSLVDMEFVVNYPVETSPPNTSHSTLSRGDRIPAHRVIVASRCDWFRRALMSGMKESIQRKIEVYESDPELFRIFLSYIYSGSLDCHLSMETLSELLLLSDRYEFDELKCSCENYLLTLMDEESVLYLTSIADQCNAKDLKRCAINFILSNPNIVQSDVFRELESELQNEIKDACTSANNFKYF